MAKSKSRGRVISTHTTSNARATALPRATVQLVRVGLPTVEPLFDRRVFTPTKSVTLGALNKNATRLVVDKRGESIRNQTKAKIQFNVPPHVALCVRRKIRKEVIHAIGKSGRGIPRRRPRRNQFSDVKC